jgi:hypothetical protein
MERDIWIMVDEESQQTLFRLVKAGGARDAERLIREVQLPVVMVEVRVPPTGLPEATPGVSPGSARAILIVLMLHRLNDGDAVGLAYKSALAPIATSEWQMPRWRSERES